MALWETRGVSTHPHCCPLEAVPKERADGLQIFLKVRKCYYLLQPNWKRKKKEKIPTEKQRAEMEGQKMCTFYINLEISFNLKKKKK